jgi:hypothetical protein
MIVNSFKQEQEKANTLSRIRTGKDQPFKAKKDAPMTTSKHSHRFVETYDGLVGFGLDRQTDEKTMIYYLQKFSDDAMADVIVQRMQDDELAAMFEMLSNLLRRHLSESEYHELFLKDEHD